MKTKNGSFIETHDVETKFGIMSTKEISEVGRLLTVAWTVKDRTTATNVSNRIWDILQVAQGRASSR